ncbi:Retrovirus-related Pol polyprotein from transposon 17.6, partial [Mucuna pruriens]
MPSLKHKLVVENPKNVSFKYASHDLVCLPLSQLDNILGMDWLLTDVTLELAELKKLLKEILKKQFGTPVLLMKKGGSIRWCVDYHHLNKTLRLGYHQIRVNSKDVLKTTFRIRYGHYEYLVMPFGMTNAPGVFMNYMNKIFHPYLDSFIIMFIDDILGRACEAPESCVARGIAINPSKIEVLLEWETPKFLSKIRSFLRLVGYYIRFIEGFSKLALSLTRLTRKRQVFVWDFECENSFLELKKRLTSALVLLFPHLDEPFVVYCMHPRWV